MSDYTDDLKKTMTKLPFSARHFEPPKGVDRTTSKAMNARRFAKELNEANRIFQEGEIDRSIQMYSDLLESDPEEPLVYYNMALALMEKENYPLALKLFSHLSKMNFEEPRVWIGIGYCQIKEGLYEEAFTSFSQVREDQEGFVESTIGKVFALVLESKIADVAPLLDQLKQRGVWNQELALIQKILRKKSRS